MIYVATGWRPIKTADEPAVEPLLVAQPGACYIPQVLLDLDLPLRPRIARDGQAQQADTRNRPPATGPEAACNRYVFSPPRVTMA